MSMDFSKLNAEAHEICKKLEAMPDFEDYLKECGLSEEEAVDKYFGTLEYYHNRLEEITEILEKNLEVE